MAYPNPLPGQDGQLDTSELHPARTITARVETTGHPFFSGLMTGIAHGVGAAFSVLGNIWGGEAEAAPRLRLSGSNYKPNNFNDSLMADLNPAHSRPYKAPRFNPIQTPDLSFDNPNNNLAQRYLGDVHKANPAPRTVDEWYAHTIQLTDQIAQNNGFHPPSQFQGKTINSYVELINPDHPKGRQLLEEYYAAHPHKRPADFNLAPSMSAQLSDPPRQPDQYSRSGYEGLDALDELAKQLENKQSVTKLVALRRNIAYERTEAATIQRSHKIKNDYIAAVSSRLRDQEEELFRLTREGIIKDPFRIEKKEKEFSSYIFNKYLFNTGIELTPLDWYQLTEIVDYIAHHTKSDQEFRIVLWGLFGASIPNEHTPLLTSYVDPKNPGLQDKYLNYGLHSRYDQEQIHHYLAGATGDFDNSHQYNNFAGDFLIELREAEDTRDWNIGDWTLFQVSQAHRDAFVSGNSTNTGRFTVAPNMRKLLKPKQIFSEY